MAAAAVASFLTRRGDRSMPAVDARGVKSQHAHQENVSLVPLCHAINAVFLPAPIAPHALDSPSSVRILKSFARQDEAAACIDDLLFSEAVSRRCSWSELPVKLFSVEVAPPASQWETPTAASCDARGLRGSSRRFVVADVDSFFNQLVATRPQSRHFYEIIRADTPVHLFFDLEFARGAQVEMPTGQRILLNTGVNGDALLACLLHKVALELRRCFGLIITAADVLVLESSTTRKFSRHCVIHVRDRATGADCMFCDAVSCGLWVKQHIVASLRRDCDAGDPLADAMWVETPVCAGAGAAERHERQLFIDTGVYTRNRAMRLMFCCKLGKGTPLLPAACNRMGLCLDDSAGLRAGPGELQYWLDACCVPAPVAAACSMQPAVPAVTDAIISSAAGEPLVQVGGAAWERRVWMSGLITGALPALEMMRAVDAAQAAVSSAAKDELPPPSKRPRTGTDVACLAVGGGTLVASVQQVEAAPTRARVCAERCCSAGPCAHVPNLLLLYCAPATTAAPAPTDSFSTPDSAGGCPLQRMHGPLVMRSAGAYPVPLPRLYAFVCVCAAGPAAAALDRWAEARSERAAGGPVRVRAWALAQPQTQLPAAGVAAYVQGQAAELLVCEMSGTRWCNRVNRQHRSNGVRWTVDLIRGATWQSCWDADCKGFRSSGVAVPLELLPAHSDSH